MPPKFVRPCIPMTAKAAMLGCMSRSSTAKVIHNGYIPHLPAPAAAYDHVHTRARGPYECPPLDANGPVAPADPGRWCVGRGYRSHAARHHLHQLDLIASVLKALGPNQILLIFLHND